MRLRSVALVGLAFALAVAGLAAALPFASADGSPGSAPAAVHVAASSTAPITGNVTGPDNVATSSNATFRFNASGGPAFSGGALVGKLAWTASISGPNTTGTSATPSSGNITSLSDMPVSVSVKTNARTGQFTLSISLTSYANATDKSATNTTGTISKTFRVLIPFTLHATLVANRGVSVLPFQVQIALDGTNVATVTIPKLDPNGSYRLTYRYAQPGLSSGYHTFTLTIANAHGLVTFSNGRTVIATTFYVAPATTSNTVYYVLGIVAFLGVLFIYATRVGARRRGVARR